MMSNHGIHSVSIDSHDTDPCNINICQHKFPQVHMIFTDNEKNKIT